MTSDKLPRRNQLKVTASVRLTDSRSDECAFLILTDLTEYIRALFEQRAQDHRGVSFGGKKHKLKPE